MLDFHAKLELVHLRNPKDLDLDFGLEVSTVLLVEDKGLEFVLEKLDVLQTRLEVNEEIDLLSHRIRSRDVLDPSLIEDNVRNLHRLVVVYPLEDGE